MTASDHSLLGADLLHPPVLPSGFSSAWCSHCSRWLGLPEERADDAYREHMDACSPPEHTPTWEDRP